MPLTINTNTLSLNAQRNLTFNTLKLSKSMEKLASGFRINRAGDDAAGLQLSEGLRAQIRGSQKGLDNTMDGLNVLNIADGALQTIGDNLQRIRELLVQAASDTYAQPQRDAMAMEIQARIADNDRIAASTQFNGVQLLDGSGGMTNIQVGPNNTANDVIDISSAFVDFQSASLPGEAAVAAVAVPGGIASNAIAQTAIGNIDLSIAELNLRRGNLGALTNRLESAQQNLLNSIENLSASESRIRNVDVAAESAELTKWQVLQQSAAIVLSQANQTPQIALQLLKG